MSETYDIECPHCDEAWDDDASELAQAASKVGNSTVDETCPSCGKAFDVSCEWSVDYYCSKKETP